MSDVVGLVSEVFTWVGFGGGIVLLGLALLLQILDGTWLHTRAVVEYGDDVQGVPAVVRWFDEDGNVNESPLSPHDVRGIAGADMVDIWYRRGWIGRMRLHRGSHSVRGVLGLAALLIGVAVVATIVQLVVMASAG